jgi:hypothetical protein
MHILVGLFICVQKAYSFTFRGRLHLPRSRSLFCEKEGSNFTHAGAYRGENLSPPTLKILREPPPPPRVFSSLSISFHPLRKKKKKMTSVEGIAAAPTPAQFVSTDAVNVYCVEATADSTERMRTLLERLHKGEVPTALTLTRAGMKGLELAASADTTIEDIRRVVEQQRLCGSKAGTTTAAAAVADDAHLAFFAVSRGATHTTACALATPAGEAMDALEADSDDADPLVVLPDELPLEEVLRCPQLVITAATTPTVLLFYASSVKWGGHCCCCGELVAAVMAVFCGCCGHRRRSRQRPPQHSLTNNGNPLNGDMEATCYPNTQVPVASYPVDNRYYPQYSNKVDTNYPAVQQPQMYYPPPPVAGSSSGSDGGVYYKPI